MATERSKKLYKNKIAIFLKLLGDENVNIVNTYKFDKAETCDGYEHV